MWLMSKGGPDSQAGRRGFESRLPLHLFNDLGAWLQRPSPFKSIYITSILFSKSFTACRLRPNDAYVYTFSFTSTVCPICSALTCGSTPRSSISELWVRRMTWKFAQPKPTGDNLGKKCRRQQLSLDTGVIILSEGNTQASSPTLSDNFFHSSIESSNPSDKAAQRVDRIDFGESMPPR